MTRCAYAVETFERYAASTDALFRNPRVRDTPSSKHLEQLWLKVLIGVAVVEKTTVAIHTQDLFIG